MLSKSNAGSCGSTNQVVIYSYDGDGTRIVGTVNGVTTVYIGSYEWTSAGNTKYYPGGGMRRTGYSANNGLFWMLSDHLGSTTAIVRGYGTAPEGVTFEQTHRNVSPADNWRL